MKKKAHILTTRFCFQALRERLPYDERLTFIQQHAVLRSEHESFDKY